MTRSEAETGDYRAMVGRFARMKRKLEAGVRRKEENLELKRQCLELDLALAMAFAQWRPNFPETREALELPEPK